MRGSPQPARAFSVHVPFLRMRNTMLVRLSLRKASGCSDKKAHAKFCGSMQDAAYTDGGCTRTMTIPATPSLNRSLRF